MLPLSEQEKRCILYILCHKDYHAVYVSECSIRTQNVAQGGWCGEKSSMPSFQSSTLLCSPSEDGAQALFTPTLRQTWVSRPTSYGPQHQTAAQQSHLGCYIPRHCCLLSRTYDPVLDSTEPWLHHCKVPMLWELLQALHEKIQGSA